MEIQERSFKDKATEMMLGWSGLLVCVSVAVILVLAAFPDAGPTRSTVRDEVSEIKQQIASLSIMFEKHLAEEAKKDTSEVATATQGISSALPAEKK